MSTIWLIENDFILRDSLAEVFRYGKFNVSTFKNGYEAWKELKSGKMPDLVITDLFMPLMDGLELTEKIKSTPKLSNIPVILAASNVLVSKKLKDLELEADAIIEQPIETDLLLETIQLALEAKITHSTQKLNFPSKLGTISRDNRFMLRLNNVSNTYLQEVDFDELATTLNQSKSTLERKIRRITGLSLNQYFKQYRLELAKVLIISDNGNMSEIADRTGFTSLSYFSQAFKNHFDYSPREVKRLYQYQIATV